MAEKSRPAPEPAEIIPAWVYGRGVKDTEGNPVEPGSYAYVSKLGRGMQPADTDPLLLKYPTGATYKTRQIKAETDSKGAGDETQNETEKHD